MFFCKPDKSELKKEIVFLIDKNDNIKDYRDLVDYLINSKNNKLLDFATEANSAIFLGIYLKYEKNDFLSRKTTTATLGSKIDIKTR